MYQPSYHREDRLEVQHDLIRRHPLGLVVTMGSRGLVANPIPFIVDAGAAPKGVLRGHLARANEQWREVDASVEALVIFQGAHSYISPSWYATKRETGKVVPTWNYAIVQAHGPLKAIEDAAWLEAQIIALTRLNEGGRDRPWAVSDAPDGYIRAVMKGIVGIEIPISRVEGKWKLSQNRSRADRDGVIAGLRAQPDEASRAMADLVAASLEDASGEP